MEKIWYIYFIFPVAYIGFFYFIAAQSLSIAPKVRSMIYAFPYRCITQHNSYDTKMNQTPRARAHTRCVIY